jgi:hypothetical protein
MRDNAESDKFLMHHFSHSSGPGAGLWLPRHSIAQKSAMLQGAGHWKGSASTRFRTSTTDGVDNQGFGTSGVSCHLYKLDQYSLVAVLTDSGSVTSVSPLAEIKAVGIPI